MIRTPAIFDAWNLGASLALERGDTVLTYSVVLKAWPPLGVMSPSVCRPLNEPIYIPPPVDMPAAP